MVNFDTQWASLSGGTYVTETPTLNGAVTYSIRGEQFTAYTTTTNYQTVNIRRNDYPVANDGFPQSPANTGSNAVFFQEGAGWYQSTPQHRSPDQFTPTYQTYTGQNLDNQVSLEPFTYGGIYLQRFSDFPYMMDGYKLRKVLICNHPSYMGSLKIFGDIFHNR